MGFRDEGEAIRARIEALSSELAEVRSERDELRGERERARDLEKRLRRAEDELATLRGQIPEAKRRLRAALIGAGVLLMVATIASVLFGVQVYDAAERARSVEIYEGPRPLPPLAEGERAGVVTASYGAGAVPPGTRCHVALSRSVDSPGHLRGAINGDVTVLCGEEHIFRGGTGCSPPQPPFTRCGGGSASRVYVDGDRAIVQHGPEDPWIVEVQLED